MESLETVVDDRAAASNGETRRPIEEVASGAKEGAVPDHFRGGGLTLTLAVIDAATPATAAGAVSRSKGTGQETFWVYEVYRVPAHIGIRVGVLA